MKLEGLLYGQSYQLVCGDMNTNILGLANDSRKVEQGYVFIAIKGFEQDGHRYINQAIQNGAVAIVIEDLEVISTYDFNGVTIIHVENARKVMASMATHFYNSPSTQFKLVGVTGTNGKTSTVFLINNVLEYLNHKTGLIGTILNKIDQEKFEAERTTPESIEVQHLFRQMADANVNDVVMEVSSHALDLYRVAYARFDVGVFTNLTLDHLDYHKTMDNYRDAKAKLFDMCEIGVVNDDDPVAEHIMHSAQCKEYMTLSTHKPTATLYASNIENHLSGVNFDVSYKNVVYPVKMQTPGEFSVYNGLTAMGALLALQIPIESIIEAFRVNSQIKGRFQSIASPTGYTAIIDYAHAPDGLSNVLGAMKGFGTKKIITVFGCGGDRDRSKRPIMGEIAGTLSDFCVITSDNPRTEEPEAIISEIEVGMKKTNCIYERITDRKEAITRALAMANEGDLVLIAGKGHEDYQIIGKVKHHFDDEEVVRDFFKSIV